MPADKALMMFAGAATVEQSQSLPGQPVSQALPSTTSRCIPDMSSLAGDYPIPGIEFAGMDYANTDWAEYQNFTIIVTVAANHTTGAYRIHLKLRITGNATDVINFTMFDDLEIPTGMSVSDEYILNISDGSAQPTVRLAVTPALLSEGASTVYTFTVSAIKSSNFPGFYAHTGGYVSPYASAPWYVSGGGTVRASMFTFDNFLHCVGLRFISGEAAGDIEFRIPNPGQIRIRYAGVDTDTAAGVLALTGSNRYISIDFGAGVITFYFDVEEAKRTYLLGAFGTWGRADTYYFNNNPLYIRPQVRSKNSLLAPVYKGISVRRGYFFKNISALPVTLSIAKVNSAAGLNASLEHLDTSPDTVWRVGDGITTGIPSETPIGYFPSLTSVPSEEVEIPVGQVAGVVLRLDSTATVESESNTELVLLAI